MFPIIPIAVAVTMATILIRSKVKNKSKNASLVKLVDYVMSKGIQVDADGNFNPDTLLDDGTPILFDIALYRQDLLIALLEYGANPNICDAKGVPAISFASSNPLFENVVVILLKYGANPNAMDSEGNTAIFYARTHNVLKQLCMAGADMDAENCVGKTAIFNSLKNATTKSLVKLGSDINAKDMDGRNIGFYARSSTDFQILKELGADLNAVDNLGRTALMYSFDNNVIFNLYASGIDVDVNIWDREGKTAIFYAKSRQHIDILKKMGVDLNAKDNMGRTALFYASSQELAAILVKNGASPAIRDNEGKTVAFYITDAGTRNLSIISLFEQYGMDVDAVDNCGENFKYYKEYKEYKSIISSTKDLSKALYEAVNNGDIEKACAYIRAGANLDTRDVDVKPWNMIHLAIYRNNPRMIEALVLEGVDMNAKCGGIPPLLKAIYDNRIECVKTLLELGVDTKCVNEAVCRGASKEIKQIFKVYDID